MKQNKNEKVQAYAARLEKALNQIRVKFSSLNSEVKVDWHLRDTLFYSMKKTLQDNLQYLCDNHLNNYTN